MGFDIFGKLFVYRLYLSMFIQKTTTLKPSDAPFLFWYRMLEQLLSVLYRRTACWSARRGRCCGPAAVWFTTTRSSPPPSVRHVVDIGKSRSPVGKVIYYLHQIFWANLIAKDMYLGTDSTGTDQTTLQFFTPVKESRSVE